MSYVKTAISIKKNLLIEADDLARQMNIPRSRLFVIAMQEYIQRQKNIQLLEQINEACSDYSTSADQVHLDYMKQKHRLLMEEF